MKESQASLSYLQYCMPSNSVVDSNPKYRFWLDPNPNPKKSSDSDTDSNSDSDTVVGWKFLWKIKNQTLERENFYVFRLKIFFSSDVQVPEPIWKQLQAPFRKIWGQNISLRIRIRIRKKINCGSEFEKNELGSTVLPSNDKATIEIMSESLSFFRQILPLLL
jgi:hypothetical protein